MQLERVDMRGGKLICHFFKEFSRICIKGIAIDLAVVVIIVQGNSKDYNFLC